jgi:hypothetical protein
VYDPAAEIDQVNWQDFSTAYGIADNVPSLLRQLAAPDAENATEASHNLWCGLCHQHAYVSSAALPSYPILLKVLHSADEELAVEILDILLGFARCTAPVAGIDPSSRPHWEADLHDQMIADKGAYEAFAKSGNEVVRGFASDIIEALGKTE